MQVSRSTKVKYGRLRSMRLLHFAAAAPRGAVLYARAAGRDERRYLWI